MIVCNFQDFLLEVYSVWSIDLLLKTAFTYYLTSSTLILRYTYHQKFIPHGHTEKSKTPYSTISLIHFRYFYSASSSPLLHRGDPDYSIDSLLCQS